MAVDYQGSIDFLLDVSDIEKQILYLGELPDTCPVCNYSVSPNFILIYEKNNLQSELICGCPRNECRSLFTSVYYDKFGNHRFVLLGSYPTKKVEIDFPVEVSELSSDFVTIYNQANHAEKEGLDMICGVGYRKALEYLIKDFAIHINPDEKTSIQRIPLQKCVQKFISESTIKEMAERAIWLGNDETHYVRKWNNKDIQDLKNLIDLTVFYLSMSLKASKYKEDMNR